MIFPTVTEEQGTAGGGEYPLIPFTVRHFHLNIPKGHHVIGGRLYRETFDPEELLRITYSDGSHPTACALVPVDWPVR